MGLSWKYRGAELYVLPAVLFLNPIKIQVATATVASNQQKENILISRDAFKNNTLYFFYCKMDMPPQRIWRTQRCLRNKLSYSIVIILTKLLYSLLKLMRLSSEEIWLSCFDVFSGWQCGLIGRALV